MADSSYDIISEINKQELTNAIDQAKREISTRFDFKNSKSEIILDNESLELISDDEGKMKQLIDVVETKLIKREISLKGVVFGDLEKAQGGLVRRKATFVQGIESEMARKINKAIKKSKLKVKSQVMDQKIRVSGKSKDDLQAVMKLLKESKEINIPLQYTNYK